MINQEETKKYHTTVFGEWVRLNMDKDRGE